MQHIKSILAVLALTLSASVFGTTHPAPYPGMYVAITINVDSSGVKAVATAISEGGPDTHLLTVIEQQLPNDTWAGQAQGTGTHVIYPMGHMQHNKKFRAMVKMQTPAGAVYWIESAPRWSPHGPTCSSN